MSSYLHAITTATPANAYAQEYLLSCMQSWLGNDQLKRKAAAVYRKSGIDTRYSILSDFQPGEEGKLFRMQGSAPANPRTALRNTFYQREANDLIAQLGNRLIEQHHVAPETITHLIYVTCTGFTNPGPDIHLMHRMNLRPDVQRLTLGFMGCQAALPALRTAHSIVNADRDARVLVVCLELCTPHFQLGESDDSLLANALFADGAAAALVTGQRPSGPCLQMHAHRSHLLSEGESDMAWTIGDHGFDIRLSAYVPELLARQVPTVLAHASADAWAVHPGGRRILDMLEQELSLPDRALHLSRDILRRFGNMSSATLLFVLQQHLEQARAPHSLMALAFGPGLTLESARMTVRVKEPVHVK